MRFCVLGPLVVEGDDAALLRLPGAKERLLLALLCAAAPSVVGVDRLVDVLWDGAPPPTAHKSMQAHVVHLRSALEPDRPRGSTGRYVVRRGSGYALAVGRDAVDALAIGDLAARGRAQLSSGDPASAERQLAAALALWRGEPYADWADAAFAHAERVRLAEVRAGALAGLLEARLALGRHADVVPELERLVAQEPLREGWWSLLMLALYRDGRQAHALAAGRRVRALLAAEVGADPGPGLRRIEAAILEHDPALDLPAQRNGLRPDGFGPALAAPPAADAPQPTTAACPYMGLAAYQVEDAALFRGRQRVVAGLLRALVGAPVLVVSGPSGAGKSSVVRAGLLPALARGALPGSEGWDPVVLTPGSNPVDALAGLTGESPPRRPVVLVGDQFEELWAPGVEAAERAAFLDALLGLIDDGVLARSVLIVRGDYVGRLAEHAALTDRLAGTLVLIPPLTDPELREVVEEPARSAGLSVESELLDAVVTDVVGQPAALPLLSTALVGTWERRRGSVLTLAGYLQAGGVAGALSRSAEAAYAALPDQGRGVAKRLLVRLADINEHGELVRRRVPLRELDLAGDGGEGRREVVEVFVRRRLLAVDAERLEVAHEALLTAWPRLQRWLEDDAAGRTVRRYLAPAALAWDTGGRVAEELYRGARLGGALDWAAGRDADVTPVERDFLDASRSLAEADLRAARERADREARSRHRTVRLAAVLAAVLVLALVAAGLAVRFQRAADARALEADANGLAALSSTVRPLDVSLLLAAQAVRLAETPRTQDGLLSALMENRRAARVSPLELGASDVALGGGGQTLFVTVPAGNAPGLAYRPVDAATDGQLVHGNPPDAIDASPTEDLVASLYRDFTEASNPGVRVFRSDGTLVFRTSFPDVWPRDVAFGPDGRRVLVATGNTRTDRGFTALTVRERDPANREWRDIGSAITTSTPTEIDAAFSDDASTLVAWTAEPVPSANLLDVRHGSRVPLTVARRAAASTRFVALPTGAAQLWDDGAITRYDAAGQQVQTLDLHRGTVRDVLVAPTGAWAATAGNDGTIALWDVDAQTGNWSVRETLAGHTGEVVGLELDPTGSTLYSAATDGRFIAWDVTSAAGFGASYPGLVDRWITSPPRPVADDGLLVAATRPVSPSRGGGGIEGAEASDTGAVAATFFDARTGRVVAEVPVGTTPGGRFGASVAVSPDGRRVAVTSELATTVLDTRTRAALREIVLPGAFSAPPSSGDPARDPPERVRAAGWTPDGSRLLLGADGVPGYGDGGLVVVDPASWQVERRVHLGGAVQVIEPSPDGRWLAVGNVDDPQVWLLDATTLETVRALELTGGARAYDLAFSPGGRWLAAGGEGGLLSVFDTKTWRRLHDPVQVDYQFVQQLEWLPDGRTVLASGYSGEVALYDVRRGLIRALPLPGSSEPGAGYTHLVPGASDELIVLGGERDGTTYPMRPAQWLADACTIVGQRDLTPAEWSRYLPGRAHEPTCSDLP